MACYTDEMREWWGNKLPQPKELWKHRSGGMVQVVCNACHVEEHVWFVIYRDWPRKNIKSTWASPVQEFMDGRFEKVEDASG